MAILPFSLFVLLMHHSSSDFRPQCPNCEQTSCNCSRQNLREVPAAPSELITQLDLSFNRLRTITKTDFAAYVSLQSLIVSNNEIQIIEEQAFVPLTNLVNLDLSFNRLDMLSAKWFENLCLLQSLNLLGNKYRMLGQGNLFIPLKRLKRLYFGGPYLQTIRIEDFSGLTSLEEVVFDGHNLQIYTEGSMRHIGPIKYLTLCLDGPFRSGPSLVKAILSDVMLPGTTLTISDTFFFAPQQMSPLKVLNDIGTTHFVLKNVNITFGACLALLTELSDSNITMFVLENIHFYLSLFHRIAVQPMKHLEEVVLKNVDIPDFYNFPAIFFLQPLQSLMRKLSVLNCKIFNIPCQSSSDFSNLEYMDMSDNIISDLALSQMLCDGNGTLLSLKTLNISRNQLHSINSQLFTRLDKLENLDMSGNVFHSMPDSCYWPQSLQFLNLSSTLLSKVTACLPVSLHVLDVSKNALTTFNIELPFLTKLYISGNKLSRLPGGGLCPQLSFLSIQNNDLQTLSSNDVNDYNHLKTLEAGANTYACSCDFLSFMTSDLAYHPVTVGDGLKAYICDSPDAVRGESVLNARLSVFECHRALAFSLLCLGILAAFVLVAGLCYKYSVAWYMRMTWAWLRAKKKPKLKKGALEYDAFVSYSEMDSGWVDAHLIPELEQSEPPLRLCLHKRDFIPGGWILDNIMDAIEKSHRTLFVLSQNFVRSEWCQYELNYTHFRLFDQNDDTVVLILLEPIDKDTIPKKFCKLRRVMNSRTYLEWPDDDNQIPRFWQSLRTAIVRPKNNGGNCEKQTEF